MLRPADAAIADLVATSHRVVTRVDAWRGGDLIAEDVPLLGGELSEFADQRVPERITLSVPSLGPDGRSWSPKKFDDPLECNGQRLRLTYTIPRDDSSIASCLLGWFRVDEWEQNGSIITVTALGLNAVLDSYRLLSPTSPATAGTLGSEIVRLVDGELPTSVTATGDRACPKNMAWQDDRLAALFELATAWPAELRVDPSGVLTVTNLPTSYAADLVLTEGLGGTVIATGDGGSRDGVANVVVARGEDATAANRAPVVGIARDTDPASPTFVDAYDPVVKFFASPLLTTTAQANAAAASVLARSKAAASAIPVSTLPDPRLTHGTRVELRRADGRVQNTVVLSSVLPLTAGGGAQRLTLGIADA